MKLNRTNTIIAASFIALVALFAFQVKWMTASRDLIEEQFNQKVSMALCYAVDIMGDGAFSNKCAPAPNGGVTCLPVEEVELGFQFEKLESIEVSEVEHALAIALDFYNVKMKYDVEVSKKQELKNGNRAKYSCKLNPLEKDESDYLLISFPGKDQYIFGKLKFMFITSIVILTFLTIVFLLSSYTMVRQRRLHQINKDFFNNMAHEFRTPLTNISLASTLLSKNRNETRNDKYLGVIKEESKKLAVQVDRILYLSKMENGEYQLVKEELCLKELIQNVIDGMDIQIKEKNAIVKFEIEKNLVSLEGDKFHLGNVFRNLLENALKYSTINPEINIELKRDENGLLIHFQDNGIGIPKKDQKEIFEKYYRVNNGNVHNQKGFGLGLAYVKMIIERHKGFIKIISDLNKGTRFDLFLPAK